MYLLQEITKVTSIYQRKIKILQGTLAQLQMEEQKKKAEEMNKVQNHEMKKKKKKTPVRKRKRRRLG